MKMSGLFAPVNNEGPGGEHGREDADHSQRHRRGQSLQQDHRHRIAVAEADAEIAGQRRPDIAEELFDDGLVQTAGRPQRLGRSPPTNKCVGIFQKSPCPDSVIELKTSAK